MANIKPYLPLILIAVLAFSLYGSAISVLVFKLQPSLNPLSNIQNRAPTVTITLYVGEVSNNQFGFGPAGNNLTSPGPTLRFKITDVVSITVVNVGTEPHAFAITAFPASGSRVLFNSEIASPSDPLMPGQRRTTIFVPADAGSFYYICPISGHADLGMYGSVIITG
jgi:FtsP/CotA-like multicopper oxidase with cupredoxin domain